MPSHIPVFRRVLSPPKTRALSAKPVLYSRCRTHSPPPRHGPPAKHKSQSVVRGEFVSYSSSLNFPEKRTPNTSMRVESPFPLYRETSLSTSKVKTTSSTRSCHPESKDLPSPKALFHPVSKSHTLISPAQSNSQSSIHSSKIDDDLSYILSTKDKECYASSRFGVPYEAPVSSTLSTSCQDVKQDPSSSKFSSSTKFPHHTMHLPIGALLPSPLCGNFPTPSHSFQNNGTLNKVFPTPSNRLSLENRNQTEKIEVHRSLKIPQNRHVLTILIEAPPEKKLPGLIKVILYVQPHTSVADLKQLVGKSTGIPITDQQVFLTRIPQNDRVLLSDLDLRRLFTICIAGSLPSWFSPSPLEQKIHEIQHLIPQDNVSSCAFPITLTRPLHAPPLPPLSSDLPEVPSAINIISDRCHTSLEALTASSYRLNEPKSETPSFGSLMPPFAKSSITHWEGWRPNVQLVYSTDTTGDADPESTDNSRFQEWVHVSFQEEDVLSDPATLPPRTAPVPTPGV